MSGFLNQNFSTIKVPNTRLALYTLSIRYPGPALLSFMTYTFPISPSSLRKSYTAMAVPYESYGTPIEKGVRRNIDVWGNTPVNYVLEGTTGWDRHGTDGMLFTGLQSIQQIQYMCGLYASLNQVRMLENNPELYRMELYDYFNQEFWQVEPIGAQEIRQSSQAPTLQFYRMVFAGVQPVSAPLISNLFADPVQQLFAAGSSAAARGLQDAVNSALGIY